MMRTMCKSKIHRATVTGADLNYVGSITIDAELMEAAELREFEQVHVVVISYGQYDEAELAHFQPLFIFVDEENRISRDALRAFGS
jgi:aspartate 1-decarboxylase